MDANFLAGAVPRFLKCQNDENIGDFTIRNFPVESISRILRESHAQRLNYRYISKSKIDSETQNCFAVEEHLSETACMKLDDSVALIKEKTERMNSIYGSVIFDEWAIVSFKDKTGRVLSYHGSRKESFQKNFGSDV